MEDFILKGIIKSENGDLREVSFNKAPSRWYTDHIVQSLLTTPLTSRISHYDEGMSVITGIRDRQAAAFLKLETRTKDGLLSPKRDYNCGVKTVRKKKISSCRI